MITTMQMYWITRLDGIVTLLAILASFLCVASAIMFVCGRCESSAVEWMDELKPGKDNKGKH